MVLKCIDTAPHGRKHDKKYSLIAHLSLKLPQLTKAPSAFLNISMKESSLGVKLQDPQLIFRSLYPAQSSS